MDKITKYIQDSNGRQLTTEEMIFLTKNVQFPCKLLMFGMGADTFIWRENKDTLFVEDNPDYFVKGVQVYHAKYWTKAKDYKLYFDNPKLIINPLVRDFDVVIVDGPFGGIHGRCQSIATAAKIREKYGAKVFVHDCHRPLEREYCDHYLKGIFTGVHHLRYYE